jgi:hypothetical protein
LRAVIGYSQAATSITKSCDVSNFALTGAPPPSIFVRITFLEVSMRNLGGIIITAFVLLGTSSAQSQDFFGSISGNWMSGRNFDEPVWFTPTFEGYEAIVPFFLGQSKLSRSDGRAASNVRIESRAGQVCWYSVGAITSREMTWTLRDGNSPGCPRSELFRRG